MISLDRKKLKQENSEKLNRENFRVLMECMSRPGKVDQLEPLSGSTVSAVASALLYQEVTWCNMTSDDLSDIAFTTGSKEAQLADADYIFANEPSVDVLTVVGRGTYESPELGGTIFFRCETLDVNKYILTGPGINKRIEVSLPINREFAEAFKVVNSKFPTGVDVFFIDDQNRITALARTTKLELV